MGTIVDKQNLFQRKQYTKMQDTPILSSESSIYRCEWKQERKRERQTEKRERKREKTLKKVLVLQNKDDMKCKMESLIMRIIVRSKTQR